MSLLLVLTGGSSPDVTVAATGVAGTGSVGNLIPAITVALTGNQATGFAGNLGDGEATALTGVVGTGAAGTMIPANTQALAGVFGTGAVGLVGPAIDIALTGTIGTGNVGTMSTGGDVTVALSGVESPGSAGDMLAASVSGGAGDYEEKKKKYIVKKGDRLLVFSSKSAALHVLNDEPKRPESTPQIAVKKVILAKPEQTIDLPVIKEYATVSGTIEQYNAAYNSQHYEALIAMFEQMQDEDDIEELLLSL